MASRQASRQVKNKQQLEPLEQTQTKKILFPSLSQSSTLSSSTAAVAVKRGSISVAVKRGSISVISEGNGGGLSGSTTPRGFDDNSSFTNQDEMGVTKGINLQQWYVRAKQIHEEYKAAPPIALMV